MTAAPRTPIWQAIAEALRAEIAEGLYRPGDRLPTEAQLAARFGVNRHTVRRGLAALASAGLVHSRRGAGVFVAANPVVYPLGRRVRYHQNLRAAGQMPGREILRIETRPGAARETEALALPEGAQVHVYEGISFADGVPMALFRSAFPAARFPGLPDHLREDRSVTRALALQGVADYTRAITRLSAERATATEALRLRLPEGAALLRTQAVNVDAAGQPVEFGTTWFAGDRVTLTVTPD